MANAAFDIGQTQTRIRLGGLELYSRGFGPGGFEATLRTALHTAIEASGLKLGTVSVGSTGFFGQVPDLTDVSNRLHHEFGFSRMIVADDALTSYLGALGAGHGVVVAVGTGLVALGVGQSTVARVDGMGPLIGDDGAGWWIGRQGLIAAISARDGRDYGSPTLLTALDEKYGSAVSLATALSMDESPIASVASFAKDVAVAARAGDSASIAIWLDAAGHIARSMMAAAQGAGLSGEVSWCITGRITGASDLFMPRLNQLLRKRFPDGKTVSPSGDGLDGAEMLALPGTAMTASPLVGWYTYGD